MTDLATNWLDPAGSPALQDCCQRLISEKTSVFYALGSAATQALVVRVFSAIQTDLASGQERGIRTVLSNTVAELGPKGLGFHDLRMFATTLRDTVLSMANAAPDTSSDARSRVEGLLFRFGLDAALYLLAYRESVFQDQVTGIEVRQLEDQLSELQTAYTEKEQLLDLVKQVSTPIAPVFDGILVVPLVGVFDSMRAHALTETLLQTISEARARVVILDVSGVPLFDTATAQHLIGTARAAKLLGAEMILVGLSPRIAQTIVQLQVDLEGLVTRGTLADGLALSLARLEYEIVPMS
jgi:anti-anti-sigma factor